MNNSEKLINEYLWFIKTLHNKTFDLFIYDDWYRFLKHIENTFHLIFKEEHNQVNFKLNYLLNEEINSDNKLVVMSSYCSKNRARAVVNFDALKILQSDLQKENIYDPTLFIADYIFSSARHEIEHFNQYQLYQKEVYSYNNFLYTIEEYLMNIGLYQPNYLLKYKEVMASYQGDNFAIGLLKKMNIDLGNLTHTTELIYTYFLYYYFKFLNINNQPYITYLLDTFKNIPKNYYLENNLLLNTYNYLNGGELDLYLSNDPDLDIIYALFISNPYQFLINLSYSNQEQIIDALYKKNEENIKELVDAYSYIKYLVMLPNFSFNYFSIFNLNLSMSIIKKDYYNTKELYEKTKKILEQNLKKQEQLRLKNR